MLSEVGLGCSNMRGFIRISLVVLIIGIDIPKTYLEHVSNMSRNVRNMCGHVWSCLEMSGVSVVCYLLATSDNSSFVLSFIKNKLGPTYSPISYLLIKTLRRWG